MRRTRFRVVLPIVFGFLSLLLFAWEHENNRVLFLSAYGPTFDGAMMQTTMVAPEPGEYLKVV